MESTSLIIRLNQGEPPLLLAYGSGKFMCRTNSVQNDEILSALLEKPTMGVIQRVQLLEKGELGGKDALQLSAGSLPW